MLAAFSCGVPHRASSREPAGELAAQYAGRSLDEVMDALESSAAGLLDGHHGERLRENQGANSSAWPGDGGRGCVSVLGLQRSGTNLLETIMANCGVASCLPSDQVRGTPQWKHFRIAPPGAVSEDGTDSPLDRVEREFGQVPHHGQRRMVGSVEELDDLIGHSLGHEQRYVVMLRAPASWAASDASFHEPAAPGLSQQLHTQESLRASYGRDWSLQTNAWATMVGPLDPAASPLMGTHGRVAMVRYDRDLLLSDAATVLGKVAERLGLDQHCFAAQGEALRNLALDGTVAYTPGGGSFEEARERASQPPSSLSAEEARDIEGAVHEGVMEQAGYPYYS